MAASVFSPSPESVRMRPAAAASRTSATVLRSSSAKMRLAVFGPTPWSRITATAPGGLRSTRRVRAAISPVESSSPTLSAIVWPTPGRLVRRPSAESRATDSAVSRSVWAARR